MKSEKGVTLSSLIIYVIAMVIVVSIVAVITRYFYGNINKLSNNTGNLADITKLNTFITEEINKTGNTIFECNDKNQSPDSNYIIFYNSNDKDEINGNNGYTQYTFKNGSIYLNKIKICNNIQDCKFELIENQSNRFKIILTIDGISKETTYTLKTRK